MRRDNDKKTAEAVENVLRLSQVDRQRIQLALTSLGFDTRGSDGVLGPRSRDMIAGWQKARSQVPSGYLTAAQNQALLREAATALARHEDDQKKADEGKKKADEARTTAAAAPSTAAMANSAAANPFDGIYSGSYTQASGTAFGMAIRSVSIRIAGGAGTGTVTHPSCGSTPVSLRVSSAGDLSGEATLFDNNCGPVQATFTGRIGNGQLQYTAAGPGVRGTATVLGEPWGGGGGAGGRTPGPAAVY